MIFKARRPTGTLATIQTRPIKGDGDDVTTRIMWLQGLEPGINEGQGSILMRALFTFMVRQKRA